MTPTDELRALAERVMALTGPCREVDALAGKACGVSPKIKNVYRANRYPKQLLRVVEVYPAFTASIDAAMTLVAEGCAWDVDASAPELGIDWRIYPAAAHGRQWQVKATAATPALALTAAALLARAEGDV